MKKNSKIYLAGHSGLVGSAISRELQKQKYSKLILKSHKELNLLDQKAVNKFFDEETPEYVVLAAARVGGIKANMTYSADFLYENLQIQNNVLWAALKYNVSKLLFLGSSCIYPRDCPQPMKEEYFMTGRPEPTNEGYALAKICGMKLCEKIYEQYGRIFISCMPTNVYGENDNFDLDSSHVIPALMRRMHEAKVKKIKEVVIWGSGQSRREFLHVDDLARAVVWMLEKYDRKEFINIGTGEDISIKDLAYLIKDIVNYEGELVFDNTKPDGMPKKLLDVSKMKKYGFSPSINLKEGLKSTYEFYLKMYGNNDI